MENYQVYQMESFTKKLAITTTVAGILRKLKIKERIIMISIFNKNSYKISAAALITVLLPGLACLTDLNKTYAYATDTVLMHQLPVSIQSYVLDSENNRRKITKDIFANIDPLKVTELKINLKSSFEGEAAYKDQMGMADASGGIYLNSISSLEGIQAFANVEDLELYYAKEGNCSFDISLLKQLKKLHSLKIWESGNGMLDDTNLRALGELTGLKKLELLFEDGHQVNDLSSVYSLKKLEEIAIGGSFVVSDLTRLAGLKELRSVSIKPNESIPKIALDLKPLKELKNLVSLKLRRLDSVDTGVIGELTNLRHLELADGNIENIEPLSKLKNLNSLGLYDNSISDISPLAELTGLTELYLSRNKISDISTLSDLKALLIFGIGENYISDIAALSKFTSLKILDLRGNRINDLKPLAALNNVESLNLERNQVNDLKPISGLVKLGGLCLKKNQISDISALSNFPELQMLDLQNNKVSDIKPLAGLAQLGELLLSGNNISDYSPVLPYYNQLYNKDFEISGKQ